MTQKTIYLTIDDAPSDSFAEKVDYLLKKNIPAVFFCIGNLLEKHPKAIIDAIHKGFPIANHSYRHPHFSDISIEKCQKEITETDKIIDDLYIKSGRKRVNKWFRFPYGDKGDKRYGRIFGSYFEQAIGWKKSDIQRKTAIQNILKELGYHQGKFDGINYQFMTKNLLFQDIDWHWTFDIMEWATFENKPTFGIKNFEKIVQRMNQINPKDPRGSIHKEKRWLNSPSSEIILLHDQNETTPIFNNIIDELLEFDFQFKLPG